MYTYYLANKDRLQKRMLDIYTKNCKQCMYEITGLETNITHYTDSREEIFDCIFLNTPFIIKHIFDFAFTKEDFINAPKKDYTSDDEFFVDFEEFADVFVRETIISDYSKLVLTKYSKCSKYKIQAILDYISFEYCRDDVENKEFDDQNEFLKYCLQKLVDDQE